MAASDGAGPSWPDQRQQRFIAGLVMLIRPLERISKPRLACLLTGRLSNAIFGCWWWRLSRRVPAPPSTGLDTLPTLDVVSLGALLADLLVVVVGVVVAATGVVLETVLGAAAFHSLSRCL
jgi:hypothetical protein